MFGITISEFDDRGVLAVDLRHILGALGDKAVKCHWLVEGVEAIGPNADKLHELSDKRATLTGDTLVGLANEVSQIVDGKFSAFENDAATPWLVVSAVDSSAYDITSTDLLQLHDLLHRFPSAQFIPGMEPQGNRI